MDYIDHCRLLFKKNRDLNIIQNKRDNFQFITSLVTYIVVFSIAKINIKKDSKNKNKLK